jgi:hypothetical protein
LHTSILLQQLNCSIQFHQLQLIQARAAPAFDTAQNLSYLLLCILHTLHRDTKKAHVLLNCVSVAVNGR